MLIANFVKLSVEPVGSTIPTFVSDMKGKARIASGKELTMLCPAQGFPVPTYR